jgi:D-3-phosphoglycerate dehydrogenase
VVDCWLVVKLNKLSIRENVKKVLITTVPFAAINHLPINLLEKAGVEYLVNPIGRKLTESELAEMIEDFDVLIAGTEKISKMVMTRAKKLRLISRVGVGLDSVDLGAAESLGITVSYTPEAPVLAVSELTIGLIFSLLRSIHVANAQLHEGVWQRHFGRRISEVTIGIIGVGRIGGSVLKMLYALGARRILANDISSNIEGFQMEGIQWVNKETIYRESDIITLHVPLTGDTRNMIAYDQLMLMKKDVAIVNTARGGIINEQDLATSLKSGRLSGVALDVFNQEPYVGELAQIERCLLTSHMGSMSIDCRSRMEIEATEEAIRFLAGEPLQGVVPPEEYELKRKGA